jgi:hypothetical protein
MPKKKREKAPVGKGHWVVAPDHDLLAQFMKALARSQAKADHKEMEEQRMARFKERKIAFKSKTLVKPKKAPKKV